MAARNGSVVLPLGYDQVVLVELIVVELGLSRGELSRDCAQSTVNRLAWGLARIEVWSRGRDVKCARTRA